MKNKTLRALGIALMTLPFLFILGYFVCEKEYIAVISLGCCYMFAAGLILLLKN